MRILRVVSTLIEMKVGSVLGLRLREISRFVVVGQCAA